MNVTRNIIDACTFQLQVSLGLSAHAAGGGVALTREITRDRVGAAVQDECHAQPQRLTDHV
jgi:hypothetical protein